MCLIRISERLLKIFLRELDIQDIQSGLNSQPNFENMLAFLEEAVGLYDIRREANSKKVLKTFSGSEKIRIFKYLFENANKLDFFFGAYPNIVLVEEVIFFNDHVFIYQQLNFNIRKLDLERIL